MKGIILTLCKTGYLIQCLSDFHFSAFILHTLSQLMSILSDIFQM